MQVTFLDEWDWFGCFSFFRMPECIYCIDVSGLIIFDHESSDGHRYGTKDKQPKTGEIRQYTTRQIR